jgi:methylated-DNA-[protein]-cysteine S-methyltransferase
MKPALLARTYLETPVGLLELCAGYRGISSAIFVADALPEVEPEQEVIALAKTQLAQYFAGTLTRFNLPLDMPGPDFYQQVWKKLVDIPFGKRMTYGELAALLGNPGASRAVGMANSKNPVSIIVPCHRVVGGKHTLTDNDLRGYAGGLDRKRWLLRHEQNIALGQQTELFG